MKSAKRRRKWQNDRYNEDMAPRDLLSKLHDHPFKPFRIRLVNNTTYDITEPWMITVGESSAIVVTQIRQDDRGYTLASDWRTISISHILELPDLNARGNGSKRKR